MITVDLPADIYETAGDLAAKFYSRGSKGWLNMRDEIAVGMFTERNRDKWHPIDTAPRDGSHILLFDKIHGCMQGWFSAGEWSQETHVSPSEYSGAVWVLGDDFEQVDVEEFPTDAPCGPYGDGSVTHWMPLPKPPEDE